MKVQNQVHASQIYSVCLFIFVCNDCSLYAITFSTCIWTRSGYIQQDAMRYLFQTCFNNNIVQRIDAISVVDFMGGGGGVRGSEPPPRFWKNNYADRLSKV